LEFDQVVEILEGGVGGSNALSCPHHFHHVRIGTQAFPASFGKQRIRRMPRIAAVAEPRCNRTLRAYLRIHVLKNRWPTRTMYRPPFTVPGISYRPFPKDFKAKPRPRTSIIRTSPVKSAGTIKIRSRI
jgi:hypothetical protein